MPDPIMRRVYWNRLINAFVTSAPALLVWLVTLACVLFVLATSARAHEWYDPWCCNDHDCAPIPATSVKWTPHGWQVEVCKGDHPMMDHPEAPACIHGVFAHPEEANVEPYVRPARWSQDRDWHACIVPGYEIGWNMRCLYMPETEG